MEIVGYVVCLYAAVGAAVAIAFVATAADRVFAAPVAITLGARLLLIPAATILWPYVLMRWPRARGGS
ncbi:MAG: hypothetical protein AB7O45_06840 [Alphaproteobacteria bacterium]